MDLDAIVSKALSGELHEDDVLFGVPHDQSNDASDEVLKFEQEDVNCESNVSNSEFRIPAPSKEQLKKFVPAMDVTECDHYVDLSVSPSKHQSRVFDKISFLICEFFRLVFIALVGSVQAVFVSIRIEADSTPCAHRIDRGNLGGRVLDKSSKAWLTYAELSMVIVPSYDLSNPEKFVQKVPLPTETKLGTKLNKKEDETDLVYDVIMSAIPGFDGYLNVERHLELWLCLDGASSNMSAAHLLVSKLHQNPKIVACFSTCSLHTLGHIMSQSCNLGCSLLGYDLVALEKRLFLLSRLYTSEAVVTHDSIDQVFSGSSDVLIPVTDREQLTEEQEMFVRVMEMHELGVTKGRKQSTVYYPIPNDDSTITVFIDGEVESGTKIAERCKEAVHRFWSSSVRPGFTRFATSARCSGEAGLRWSYHDRISSMKWEQYEARWADVHVGRGDRFQAQSRSDEASVRGVYACVGASSYAASRLQKRIIGKKESAREMREKFIRDSEEAFDLVETDAYWLVHGVSGWEDIWRLRAASKVAILAAVAGVNDLFQRSSYVQLMEELLQAEQDRWTGIVRQYADTTPLYVDPSTHTVIRVVEIVKRESEQDARDLLGHLITSYLRQSKSTIHVEQAHAKHQRFAKKGKLKGMSACSAYLMRVMAAQMMSFEGLMENAKQTLEQLTEASFRPIRNIDVYVSEKLKEGGVRLNDAWKSFRGLSADEKKECGKKAEKKTIEKKEKAQKKIEEQVKRLEEGRSFIGEELWHCAMKFVKDWWRTVSIDECLETRRKTCERDVRAQRAPEVRVETEESWGLAVIVARMCKQLTGGKTIDDVIGSGDMQEDGDDDGEVVEELGAETTSAGQMNNLLPGFFLLRLKEPNNHKNNAQTASHDPATHKDCLITHVCLKPYSFRGFFLSSGGRLPENVSSMEVIDAASINDKVDCVSIFCAAVFEDCTVRTISGRLTWRNFEKQVGKKKEAPLGHADMVPHFMDKSDESFFDVETAPEKILARAYTLLDSDGNPDSNFPEQKKRKLEVVTVRRKLAQLRMATVVPLSEEDRQAMRTERENARQDLDTAGYQIRSGDTKYTEKMIEEGRLKRDSRKLIVEPKNKRRSKKLAETCPYMFDVLGKKSVMLSITSTAAKTSQMLVALNAWALRHAYVCGKLANYEPEEVRDLPDVPFGETQLVLAEWNALVQHIEDVEDKNIQKILKAVKTIPVEVLRKLPYGEVNFDARNLDVDVIDSN